MEYRAVGCAALAGRHAEKNAHGGGVVALGKIVVEIRDSQGGEVTLGWEEGGRERGREGGSRNC